MRWQLAVIFAVTALASVARGDDPIIEVEGVFSYGFELASFSPCNQQEAWALSGDSAFFERMDEVAPLIPDKWHNVVFLRLRGTLAEGGRWGHLGALSKNFRVSDVLEIRPVRQTDCAGSVKLPPTSPPARTYASESSSLIAEIDARGAEVVAREIGSDEPTEGFVLARVAEGAPSWMVVAARLRGGAPSAGRLGVKLGRAVATAFRSSPHTVLRDAPPAFPVSGLCAGPDTSVFDTYARASAELSRQVAMVRSIPDDDLSDRVAECLEALEQSGKSLRRHWALDPSVVVAP